MLRKVLVFVSAVGCLVIAFVAGGGSVATAAQGDTVLAGHGYTQTQSTALCTTNLTTSCFTTIDGIDASSDKTAASGVFGKATGDSAIGVWGKSMGSGGVGVQATAVGAGSTGVYAEGVTYGVHGKSTDTTGGWGLWGEGNDRGVYGVSSNEGVVGFGNNVGVRADSPNIALRVTGKVELSRSGVATIVGTSTTPKSSVVVSSVALSAKSMVIATVQTNAGVWVKAAVPNVGGSSVTIYLNKAVAKSVPVAWMVIEQP
jgi:hypothetical protein